MECSSPIDIPNRNCTQARVIQSQEWPMSRSMTHIVIETSVVPADIRTLVPFITAYEIGQLRKYGSIRICCGTSRDAYFILRRLVNAGMAAWVD
jgi:hypothetical protein